MKKILTLLMLSYAFLSNAQQEISARTVFEMIDKKQQIEYIGVTIVGNLDLTELSNKQLNKDSKWDKNYKSTIEVPISFKNCIFKGDFVAYKHIETGKGAKIGGLNINLSASDGETYSTDFDEDVIFENCKFEQSSEFKYSTFAKNVVFKETTFANQANFKYVVFKTDALFSSCHFDEYANFKYTTFKKFADFKNAKFAGYADFKYTSFDAVANFDNSNFDSNADFKYCDFHKEGNFNQTAFKASSDFKYSNGKRFLNN